MGERIIAIIGARLNSSRLPKKHFLPLAGKPLIERLWDRLSQVKRLDEIVLATTNDDYNASLRDWATTSDRNFFAYSGDVDNLMGRVDAVVSQYNADIILYVCGDCPLVEPTTIDRMLDCIIDKHNIDTVLFDQSGGKVIHEGFDIYRRGFWDEMVAKSTEPFEQEHIGAVYHHRGKVTPKTVAVQQEPKEYCGLEHRISVDTASDYRFMKTIYSEWFAVNAENTIVDLAQVLTRLRNEPNLKSLNHHVHQKGVGERIPTVTVVSEASTEVGLGHLTRSLVVVAALQDFLGAKVRLVIKGEPIDLPDLELVPHSWESELSKGFWQQALAENDLLIFDLKKLAPDVLQSGCEKRPDCFVVGVDTSAQTASFCDLAWYPSFYSGLVEDLSIYHKVGWDCFLLKDGPVWQRRHGSSNKKKVMILTGGSDAAGLGKTLPDVLLQKLPKEVSIDWVQGPYAKKPTVSCEQTDERFKILVAPNDIQERLLEYDAVVCVYGVSYFECLRAGIPTIVFDAIGAAKKSEWEEVLSTFPDYAASGPEEAVKKLSKVLFADSWLFSDDIVQKLRQGPQHFARVVAGHLEQMNIGVFSSWDKYD